MGLYGYFREQSAKQFSSHLSGHPQGLICAISHTPLSIAASTALNKSFQALGYGDLPCTFITLQASDSPRAGMADVSGEGADRDLTLETLFHLVEAQDPLLIIACDLTATQSVEAAFRCRLDASGISFCFGRKLASFTALETLLQSDKGKQEVWHRLKGLGQRRQ